MKCKNRAYRNDIPCFNMVQISSPEVGEMHVILAASP